MTSDRLGEISESLLAHLRLSASEATVIVDQRTNVTALVVHIFGKAASRRVRTLSEWQGYPVSFIRDVNFYPDRTPANIHLSH